MSAIDTYRFARDLKELNWKPYYPNNIVSNGLEGYYAIVNSTDSARKFTILFQYPQDENGFVQKSREPELFILLEKTYRENKPDYPQPGESCSMKDMDDVNDFGDFIRAYYNIESAKQAALQQYKMVYMYALSHILSSEEKRILREEQNEIKEKDEKK